MRKNFVFSMILVLCVVVLSFACVKTDGVAQNDAIIENNEVITVAKSDSSNKVLETRFLNMLNHNYVYNEAIYDDTALVNDSMIALLDKAEGSYIDQEILADYIFNMYGKIYKDFAFLGEASTQDGTVYILPRGYNEYNHKISKVTDNKDGSFTVITDIEIIGMDTVETLKCETLFLKAEESAFGYNILYSDIIEAIGIQGEQAEC